MKYYGKLGYDIGPTEVAPGVVDDVIVERPVYGDVLNSTINSRAQDAIIPDQDITNQFSIVADPFAHKNLHAMRYITWHGVAWEIKQLEIRPPRIIIRVGGVYRGQTVEASDDA